MPTLAELTYMYEDLPIIPPPIPQTQPTLRKTQSRAQAFLSKGHDTTSYSSFLTRLLSHFPFYSALPTSEITPVKINPFMALRHWQGNKSVVIAVVDRGVRRCAKSLWF
jgi:hypothetical protein